SAGQTATFTVTATGVAPLHYQWSKDGAAVSGATTALFTTPATMPSDDGSTFMVTVSNAVNSITSSAAKLTVLPMGPRAPQAADLRFQQVDAPSTINGYMGFLTSDILSGLRQSFGSLGTPLEMGDDCLNPGSSTPSDCAWIFTAFSSQPSFSGLSVAYQSTNFFENLTSDLNALDTGNFNTVVTSIDLRRAHHTYAISSVQTAQTSGFMPVVRQSVLPGDLQATATTEGQQGRVITAVSFDQGTVFAISYGWQADTSTVYEAKTATATIDTVGTAMAGLASEGYIITAFGGNPTDGFVIVGTRVKGDTTPRPFRVVPNGSQNTQLWDQGYAVVGLTFNANGNVTIWMGEK